MRPSVLIATPSYSGSFPECYVRSLLQTFEMDRDFDLDWYSLSGHALLGWARSQVAATFLASGASHLLCVDADMGWDPADVARLLAHDQPIVAAAGVDRHENRLCLQPVVDEHNHVRCRNGLLEMRAVGLAMMMVKREVFERMAEVYAERRINIPAVPRDAPPVFDFYPVGFYPATGGVYQGEDANFCTLARAAGFEVWLDPDVILDHVGIKVFRSDPRELFGEVEP